MVNRAKVTPDTFERKQSAIDKLVGNSPQVVEETKAVDTPTQEQQRTYKPTSIYLSERQLDKLDELALEYKKKSGKRINRNGIVRALVDSTDLDSLLRVIKE
jgi:hypothetical protein